jgi:uncharacterized protein YndB with AHSA1/START domain
MSTSTTTKLFTGTARTVIKAKADKVWDALTNPELIKQYLFGTEVVSDWKVGSSIIYKGVWEGKPYEDKGTIKELIPNRLLSTTYWSSISSGEDKPENYLLVKYELSESNGETTVTISVDNNPTQEEADHVAANWAYVLQALKDLLEK